MPRAALTGVLRILMLLASVMLMNSRGYADEFVLPKSVRMQLESACFDCHSGAEPESGLALDQLGELSLEERLDVLNRVQDQMFFGLMPPEDGSKLTSDGRRSLTGWIRKELRRHDASKLDDKLRYPSYGNYVDHDLLFSGTVTALPFTPARRWLVSPQIFHDRVMAVFRLEGWDRDALKHRSFAGVTNPFLLPEHSGVRYYDLDSLDGGHLQVMLRNARWIASRQIIIARALGGDAGKIVFPDPRDRWMPRGRPASYEAFRRVILAESPPSEEELSAAVDEQFGCVLRRMPSDDERSEYVDLLRSSIELGGNEMGLRQMLVAVLLESEFLYRMEFGAGDADESGRRLLAPREAAYAISYALGDRGPDAKLLEAANDGRLLTREDYEREIRRLLDDQQYYRGQVDSSLNGKHYRSNETSHPRIIRFFREFFGYPACLKVFKDSPRSGGKYQNPGRGSQATPGWLTLEADRFVTLHVEADRNVFENLLLSEEFFVYHDKDNETGQKIIREWSEVYEHLRDTPWKTDPEKVLKENLEFLKARKSMRIADTSRPGELVNYMHYFEESFGQGRKPFTTVPWAHGYTFHHSVFYGLPPTPSIGRYGSWKSTKFQDKLERKDFWDYPPAQPFRLPNHRGILTHPAWLIAHSTNFHTDPVRRGRWIREKLLAGRVPDIPITVDARVPEDPDQPFRQRLEHVTASRECSKCHEHMNPLGLAFEMFDDFGRFRTVEPLEHPDNLIRAGNGKTTFDEYPTMPVVTTGELSGTGETELDGPVPDALELINRLGRSERVRQSIIRHAFRFFMGRNEMLSDSRTLIEADQAYVNSGGSFREVIVALLTSDSFRYRK